MKQYIDDAVSELELREREYRASREKSDSAVSQCGKAMQLVHASRLDEAERMLSAVRPIVKEISEKDLPGAEIAQQEYAEAILLLNMIRGSELPGPKQIGVSSAAYLLGLSDALGEARREIIEHLRKDDYKTATRLFELMSEAYELMLPVRISNSVLPGFRRKLDVARSMVEQCRRDILMYKISKNL